MTLRPVPRLVIIPERIMVAVHPGGIPSPHQRRCQWYSIPFAKALAVYHDNEIPVFKRQRDFTILSELIEAAAR